MSKLLRRTLFALLALSLVLLCGCAGDSDEKSAGAESGVDAASGAPAPEEPSAEAEPAAGTISFETTDLEGNAVSEEIFSQSGLTMLNVWATYCSPCLNEMPALGELAAAYDPEEFQIIGVVSDVLETDDQELARSLVQQTGAGYTHLLLNESIYYALLTDVSAVPTTFFLDAEGNILETVVGAMEKTAWEELINGFLEEP